MTDRLFLEILKTAINGEDFSCSGILSREETEEILKTAELHRVFPLVFDKVCNFSPYEDSEKEILKKRAKLMILQQSLREDGFLKLYTELLRKGLKPVVVKGIVCRYLYPNPEFRASSDEDLLVDAEDMELYDKILNELGLRKQENGKENPYEFSYFSDDGLHIELHISLFSTKSEYFNRYNEVLKGASDRVVYTEAGKEKLCTLSPTDHFTFLILHTLKHFIGGGVGIRQVCDILLFARHYAKEIDCGVLLQRLKAVKAEKFTAGLFEIGGTYLGFEKEAEIYLPLFPKLKKDTKALLSDILCAGVYGSATMSRRHSAGMTLSAVQGKKNSVLRRLFPPLRNMDNRFSYARRFPVLLPAAWVHRMFMYSNEVSKKQDNTPLQALQVAKERTELLRGLDLISE